jgi:hypothetical protein
MTGAEGVKASSTVRRVLAVTGVLVVVPRALPEEVAVVFGSEIMPERRHFFTPIPKVCFYVYEHAESEDEGANDHQDKRKVGHNVLLRIRLPELERRGLANRRTNQL